MSTLTKFNGQIDNPNLPILTSNGLIDQQIGNFVFRLEEQGYTMSQSEVNAITTFIQTLKNIQGLEDPISYVRAVYPFVGDAEHLSAARVGIFTDTLFNFSDSFSAFELDDNNKIQGITATPAGALKVSDVATDKFMQALFAIKKPQTSSQGVIDLLRFGSDGIGYRLSDYKMNIRFRRNGSVTNVSLTNSISSPGDAGFYQYIASANNNDTPTGQYARYAKKNDDVTNGNSGAGSASNPFNIALTETDLDSSLLAETYPSGYSMECILIFSKRVANITLSEQYFYAVRQLMIDLGRIQVSND